MNFREILNFLNENIVITKTDYGNKKPFTNKEFTIDTDETFTCFEHYGVIIIVSVTQNNSLNFGVIESDNSVNYIHSDSTTKIKHVQEMYGKIIYIFEIMCKKFSINYIEIYSHPKQKKMVRLYNSFANNPNIRRIMQSLGFETYSLKQEETKEGTFKVHIFSKSTKNKQVNPSTRYEKWKLK